MRVSAASCGFLFLFDGLTEEKVAGLLASWRKLVAPSCDAFGVTWTSGQPCHGRWLLIDRPPSLPPSLCDTHRHQVKL